MRVLAIIASMLLIGCDARYNVDNMVVVAKKDLGEGLVEYRLRVHGTRSDAANINIATKDNSYQLHDRLKITNKD